MKFIIDTQLPPNLGSLFSWKGHEAKHTTQWPNGHLLNDKEIISIAQKENRIVVTKDKDFLNHYLLKGYPPAILLISIGNASNKIISNFLSQNFKQIETAFQTQGHLVILEKNRLLIW